MTTALLPDAKLNHVAANRQRGNAALEILTPQDFADAHQEISAWEGYSPTPLVTLSSIAEDIGVDAVLYKDEGPRFGLGSFKALGGAYAALRVLQREVSRERGHEVTLEDIRQGRYSRECASITLVTATDGNHGRSLAWGCARFGAACRIYIHHEVSAGRALAMQDLGADVIRIDGDYDASVALAKEEANENGWFVVSDTSWDGYSQPPKDVMSGYGVMVKEICEAFTDPPSHVFLQGGVGGLAAGVIAGMRQFWGTGTPRMIVVEPELAPCLFESAARGAPTKVEIEHETLMAGLSCGEPSQLAWKILSEEVTDFLTIPEQLVAPAMRLLATPRGKDAAIRAGESAVAGLAALIAATKDRDLAGKLDLNANSRVLLIGSEGVTDPRIFEEIMEGRFAA